MIITDSDSCEGSEGFTRLLHHHGDLPPHHPTPPPVPVPEPWDRVVNPSIIMPPVPQHGRNFTRRVMTSGD